MEYIEAAELYRSADGLPSFDVGAMDPVFEDYGGLVDFSSDWLDGALLARDEAMTSDLSHLSQDMVPFSPNPVVQSEHSYSMMDDSLAYTTALKFENDVELESESLNAINPNLAFTEDVLTESPSVSVNIENIKTEPTYSDDEHVSTLDSVDMLPAACDDNLDPSTATTFCTSSLSSPPTFVVTCTTKLVRRQPTIIVTNTRQSIANPTISTAFVSKPGVASHTLLHTTERNRDEFAPVVLLSSSSQRQYEETSVPLTPPGSSSCSSDSECSRSPKRSPPTSPRHGYQNQQQSIHQKQLTYGSSLFPSSGVLILTEEEKRTMIAEGYPIPTRLPLSKQDEKNLKKVQRKIKNKMSAQESRRKKKDYVDCLEKKLEASNQENSQLKKQLENLTSDNKSLLSQLQKLQNLASKIAPLQTSACLAVFVFCFALCMGTMTLSAPGLGLIDKPTHFTAPASDYITPSVRSRTLKTVADEGDSGLPMSAVHHHSMLDWLMGFCRPYHLISSLNQLPDRASPADDVQVSASSGSVENKVTDADLFTDGIRNTAEPPEVSGRTVLAEMGLPGAVVTNVIVTDGDMESVKSINNSDLMDSSASAQVEVAYAAELLSVHV